MTALRPSGPAALAGTLCACGLATPPPPRSIPAIEIGVVGVDYTWEVRYPGEDLRLGTADDRRGAQDLHVPQGAEVTLRLDSRDLIYTYAVPAVGVRQMAVPDVPFTARFTARDEGRFPLLGDQLCGYTHPSLLGALVVAPPDRFLEWQRGEPVVP